MGNDTLRVGDRTVALAEIEAYCREGVHIAPSNILVLLAEIRRLRAVESAARDAMEHDQWEALHRLLAAAPPETGATDA